MKSFKKEYRQAMDAIQTPQFDLEKMKKAEKRYKKAVIRQWVTVAASAAVLFVLCSAGSQAAKNYSKSFIFADENGFRTADEQTALDQAASSYDEDAMMETMSEDVEDMPMLKTLEGDEGAVYDEGADAQAKQADESDSRDFYEECQQEAAEYDGDDPEITDGEGMEITTVQYNSRQDLLASGITCSLPDRYLFGEITRERYYVVGDDYLMVDIESGDKTFYMDQSYFGNSSGHATSTVYGEKLTNKRNYVTKDGYLYVVADTPGEEDSPNGIHAAISVGDYELIVDFYGYSEKEAFEVLDHLDLSVYQ